MSTEIVSINNRPLVNTYDEVERAAKAMAASGFFQDTRQAAQAIVKIMAGAELGVGAFASMVGVNIISGKPAFSANLMASAVKRSGRYNYRVTEMTDKVCSIEYLELFSGKWVVSGISSFTIEDARKAGTKNLDKFARNMLFARAMSNGVRWYCPDVMNGAVAYTPEELGAEVDEEGNMIAVPERQVDKGTGEIEGTYVDGKFYTKATMRNLAGAQEEEDDNPAYMKPAEPKPASKPAEPKPAPAKREHAGAKRPYLAAELLEALETAADNPKAFPASDKQIKLLTSIMRQTIPDEEVRHAVQVYLWGAEHAADVVDKRILSATIRWLDLGDDFKPSDIAYSEISNVIKYLNEEDEPEQEAML